MKNNQKGVTLIALVVTIVVLLILAATSIAMLTGDDGIITNAQKAQAANTEGEVVDKMGLAYSSVRTESMVQMSTTPGYQPSANDNVKKLTQVAAKELGNIPLDSEDPTGFTYKGSGYTIQGEVTGAEGSKTGKITITYTDAKFALDAGAQPANNKYAKLVGVIDLTTTSVTYTAPTKTVK